MPDSDESNWGKYLGYGLEMAVGTRADPDLTPGRRQHQGTDSCQRLRIADGPTVGANITKATAGTHTADAWRVVADIAEMSRLRGSDRVSRWRLGTTAPARTATAGGSHDRSAPAPG